MILMKRTLAAILSLSIAASVCSVFQAAAADTAILNSTFEDGAGNWKARGTATVTVTSDVAAGGSKSLAVTGRQSADNGASYTLDSSAFRAGSKVAISAFVMQKDTPAGVTFKLGLQYDKASSSTTNPGGGDNPGGGWPGGGWPGGGGDNPGGGWPGGGWPFGGDGGAGGFDWSQMGGMTAADGDGATYETIATKLIPAGMWTEISVDSFTVPDGTNMVLYVESEGSSCDFYLDSVEIYNGAKPSFSGSTTSTGIKGDVNADRKVDKNDVKALQAFLLGKESAIDGATADIDGNSKLTSSDLSALKDLVLNPPQTPSRGGSAGVTHTAKEYNEIVAADFQKNVPSNVKSANVEKPKKIQYFSKKANRNKPANVWTPPGYDPSKKYPVMFMNHGVMGNEDNLVSGWGILEMATNLINSGDAVPFIIVFTQMYTDPHSASATGINMDVMDGYDNFVYDVRDSLYPYICENYSVATGRENTAIAGFSQGGRESLYIGMMLPDMIGYVCASSPAPGIVPASDGFIANHLGSKKLDSEQRMTNNDFKYADEDLPYILMIGGGTGDTVVGTFPKQYHELYSSNGTTHVWEEFPGAGHDASVGTPLFYNFFRYVFKA